MKKYFLVIALCAIQIVHTACAEKYTVHDLYAWYNSSKNDHIVTQEMRDDLPYYKKLMSDHVATLEHQHLTACQEGVKSAVVVAATASVVIPNVCRTLRNCCYVIGSRLAYPETMYFIYNTQPLIFGSIVIPSVIDYFKNSCVHKKSISQQYEVGKKILAQLEEYECSIELDQ